MKINSLQKRTQQLQKNDKTTKEIQITKDILRTTEEKNRNDKRKIQKIKLKMKLFR